jgi:phage terminase large subunit GpA-like protein
MRKFAEEELVIPSGPYEGRRFNCRRQPFSGLWLDEVDSGRWDEIDSTGPSQSGKTLLCFLLPVLYHLFERCERVVVGVPSLDMVSDKWSLDLLPMIERTQYRQFLPESGSASRGGRAALIRFGNGAALRFMTGGGNDKTRSHFTARVLCITETDGFDETSERSREADKISQLEARTRAHGAERLHYKECTVTQSWGHIWTRYQQGTRSELRTPCPHCGAWIAVERQHLVGWQEATSEVEAKEKAAWSCPACSAAITDEQRIASNRDAKLMHKGQTISANGTIEGPLPATRTLGFRWSAWHNLLMPAAELAADEWNGARAKDLENAEKKLCQFVWCVPWDPQTSPEDELDPHLIAQRKDSLPPGVLPADTKFLTVAVDCGKWQSWFLVLAFRADGRIHIPAYEVVEVHSDQFNEDVALLMALRQMREEFSKGWLLAGSQQRRLPDAVWVDAGDWPDVVHRFAKESGTFPDGIWMACLGRGASQMRQQYYHAPERTNNNIRRIGDGWHVARMPKYRSYGATMDADHWKLWVHSGLRLDLDRPGSVSLFDAGVGKMARDRHNKLARHFCAEQLVLDADGKAHWERHGANHWLDCAAMAGAAGNAVGFRSTDLAEEPNASIATPAAQKGVITQWFSQQT